LERSAKRRLERCAVALCEDEPSKTAKLRLAGQPFDALRLPVKLGISSPAAVLGVHRRFATTT